MVLYGDYATTTEIDVVSAEVYKIIMMNAKRSKYNEEVVSEKHSDGAMHSCLVWWTSHPRQHDFPLLQPHAHRNESKACIVSGRVNLFLSAFVVFGFSLSLRSVCALLLGLMTLCASSITFIVLKKINARWWVYVTVIHLHCIRNVPIVWKRIFFLSSCCYCRIVFAPFALSACRIRDGRMMRENRAAAHHPFMWFGREWERRKKKKKKNHSVDSLSVQCIYCMR